MLISTQCGTDFRGAEQLPLCGVAPEERRMSKPPILKPYWPRSLGYYDASATFYRPPAVPLPRVVGCGACQMLAVVSPPLVGRKPDVSAQDAHGIFLVGARGRFPGNRNGNPRQRA